MGHRKILGALATPAALALMAHSALAAPLFTQTTIAITPSAQNSVGGKLTAFDIGWIDPATQSYYLGDGSNAAVDRISTVTNTFTTSYGGQVNGADVFLGIQPRPPAPRNFDLGGPNGVVTLTQGGQTFIYAGNGDNAVKVFNAGSHAFVTSISLGATSDLRADEMAYDPVNHTLLVATPAATPSPYTTLINTLTNTVISRTTYNGVGTAPNATNGLEQSIYDAKTGLYYLVVPQVGNTGPGAVVAIDPNTGAVSKTFDLATLGIAACGPNGLAQGPGNAMILGCNASTTTQVVFDPTGNGGAGAAVVVNGVGGSDQVGYDAATNEYIVAASANAGGPVIGVIDATTNLLLQTFTTGSPGDHSVGTDGTGFTGNFYVPETPNAAPGCATGCVVLFTPVPEPSSTWVFLVALAGMAGVFWRARRTS